MYLSATIASFLCLLPSLSTALVGIDWSIDAPSQGLDDITFPISMPGAPHNNGYYFAMQFKFVGQKDVGYTGIQPRPNAKGKSIVHAVFSSFIAGTTTKDPNCSDGADGGPGVSCAIDISGSYRDYYQLEVVKVTGTTWAGTIINNRTAARTHIGQYTLPSGAQGIARSQTGFVEYYLWNDGLKHECSSLPETHAVFGLPTSKSGSVVGRLNAYEYGNCVGQVNFKNEKTPRGQSISVGF